MLFQNDNNKKPGYYADIGSRCQVFRICANTANDTGKGFAFLCPNGTLFNQGELSKLYLSTRSFNSLYHFDLFRFY